MVKGNNETGMKHKKNYRADGLKHNKMIETISIPLKKSKNIPALSENTFLRYFNFIALYVAQGIPEGMAFFGIPAWMAMNGKTPGEIGSFVAAVGLP